MSSLFKSVSRMGLIALSLFTVSNAIAVEIIAHRGASFDAPENTLASEKLAWKHRADAVETDIHLSKDGQLIVMHDKTAKRTAGRDIAVVELTLNEARKLDAGTWKAPEFAGEKIPTLDEQIQGIPAGKRLLVEIKIGPEIVPELARVLARNGASEKNITIISFNYESLKAVRAALPRYPTLYLVGYKKPQPVAPKTDAKEKTQPAPKAPPQITLDEVISNAKAAALTGLDLQQTWPLTADDTKKIEEAGLELHVWTVDDPVIARHWMDLGVKSITTNRPGWLREQLGL